MTGFWFTDENRGITFVTQKRQYNPARLPKSLTRSLIGTSCQQRDIMINQNLLCCLATGCKYSIVVMPIVAFPPANSLQKGNVQKFPQPSSRIIVLNKGCYTEPPTPRTITIKTYTYKDKYKICHFENHSNSSGQSTPQIKQQQSGKQHREPIKIHPYLEMLIT